MPHKNYRNETANECTLNRRSILLGGATVAAAAALTTGNPARSVPMSHHLDTPLASQNGQLYIDDLYVFPGGAGREVVGIVRGGISGQLMVRDQAARSIG